MSPNPLRRAAALAVLALLALVPAASAQRADSVRHAGSVRVDGSGIQVDGDVTVLEDSDTIQIAHTGRNRIVRVHGPAIVIEGDDDGIVRVFADADVAAGEHVDGDVVAVFGTVDVAGSVRGDVVAVFGSVRLAPGASVDGDAVAIGGVLDQPEGATVGGQTVALGFLPSFGGLPTLPVLLLTVVLGWLLTLFIGWMMTLLFPERLERTALTVTRHSAGSFFLGVISIPVFVIVVALLVVTVVGIPVAFLLPLVYLMMLWVGQVAASLVLGCKLARVRIGEGNPMVPIATGSAFVALFFIVGAVLSAPPGAPRTIALFLTLLGVLLIAGLSVIGTGAFLLSRAGTRSPDARPDRGAALTPSLPATPPPATGAMPT